MIRIVDIQEKLLHLIGWAQNYDTTNLKVADSLTSSESGLYFQDVHPLLTLTNLESLAPDFKNTLYPEYVPDKEYQEGNIVLYEGIAYKALKHSLGKLPNQESEYWEGTNAFSEWLELKTKASIQKAISRFCTEKAAQGLLKNLCEAKTLFEGTGRICDIERNKNNLVGFEIIPIRSKGVTIKINKIGLQFTESGDYTLYLMHSSLEEPIRIINLTKQRKNSIEWFTFNDLYLPYQSENNDAGGSWYLCYFQSELPENSKAIRKEKDWSRSPCSACSRQELLSWQAWSKYLEVHPFYINEELVSKNNYYNDASAEPPIYLWDISNNQYTYNTNYGLNLEISVACDITDFILEQRHLFQDIIQKQLAVDILKEFAYNPNVRTNRHSINASRLDILYELDGDSSSLKKSGLNYQLDLAFKALNFSTAGLDRVCLPCKNNGVKYKTI